jgi:hypothetical protein
MGHGLRGYDVPQGLCVKNRPVIQDDPSTGSKGSNQPVPHHSGAESLKEQAVVIAQVAVETVLHDMFQQHAARGMHNAFWPTRGSRTEHDVRRVIEWELGPVLLSKAVATKKVPQSVS